MKSRVPSRDRQGAGLNLWLGGLFIALLAAYSNHFNNSFHFDDSHAIVENPAIRSLSGIPRFFTDARTFSHDPAAQTYRPLVSASLAIDYALAGGLDPSWFHVSTFFWFLVQLGLMYALYLKVLGLENWWAAWFATALYGLHPSSAETINYIVQRGDLYVALGIVAGVVVYAWKPETRRYGIYLLPPLAGMFAKPTGLIFAPILLAYIVLIDRGKLRDSIPAFVLSGAFLFLERAMTPATFFSTTIKSFDYVITQPYVTLRYFRSFFLPLYLNVDTDLPAFHSLANGLAAIGFIFCALLVAAAIWTARVREWRPVSLGLWWFLLGLIPTAVFPLNEVENDHRMFLPFIGLSLAVVWTVKLLAGNRKRAAAALGLVVLALFAQGTYTRNEVWRTNETLWRDDIEKSPNNSRGHYNMADALLPYPDRLTEAISEYEIAIRLKPDFAVAHMNLGVALARIPGREQEAIPHHEESLRLQPKSSQAHANMGVALSKLPGRLPDAINEYQTAIRLQPDNAEAHLYLGMALSETPDRAIPEYQEALRIKPDSAEAHYNLGIALSKIPGRLPEAVSEFQAALQITPNYGDALTSLGIALAQIPGRLPEAITEFKIALQLKPNSAESHSNLAVALARDPKRVPEAISEFEAAYRIRPDPAVRETIDRLRSSSIQ